MIKGSFVGGTASSGNKAIGFAPMVLLFVGYLIIPMVGIGIVSMGEALSTMKGS